MPPARVLRVAHLTDPHVGPDDQSRRGLQSALTHAQHHGAELVLMGGDCILDALESTPEQVAEQWEAYLSCIAGCPLPIEHCLGNHDVFGWQQPSLYEDHPLFGKAWPEKTLGIQRFYRSFDRAGWHFVVLDSTHGKGLEPGYTAQLDEAQFQWLADDLASTSLPTLVLSHIPILAMCPFLDGNNEATGDWRVPGAWMHIDARRIKDLFLKHPHVRLCLSGHVHLVDQVLYNGVTYCCNGAVCAGWWKGPYQECGYGYGIVDLFEDGSFTNEYVLYSE